MKQVYRVLGHTLGKYRCVSINRYDHCLAGKLGEIWQDSTLGTMRAIRVLPSESEKIFTFNIKDLHRWVKRLEVPSSPYDQLKWANNPNSRFIDN